MEIDYPNQPDQPAEMAIRVVTDPAGAMMLLAMGWRIADAPERGKITLELNSDAQKQDSSPQTADSNPQSRNSGGLAPSEDAGLEELES